MAESPYEGLDITQWQARTDELIDNHPLKANDLVKAVLQSWNDIFDSRLGPKGFQIGKDIFPSPQIMAFLLHELIPLEIASRYPEAWRRDQSGREKDLVCIFDDHFSIEIKASSNPNGIYGNRSYAQPSQTNKKSKSGYYLAVNFGRLSHSATKNPIITQIRFGWLDHSDWRAQVAASGQQAYPFAEARKNKLKTLYPLLKKDRL